jgi:hypothetical protein
MKIETPEAFVGILILLVISLGGVFWLLDLIIAALGLDL